MITAQQRATRWRRNLKGREALARSAQVCRAYAARFMPPRNKRSVKAAHRDVWRTRQWTMPGYVKPVVAGSTEADQIGG